MQNPFEVSKGNILETKSSQTLDSIFNKPDQKTSKAKKPSGPIKKFFKFLFLFFIFILLVVGGASAYAFFNIYKPGLDFYEKVKSQLTLVESIRAAVATKDLNQIKAQLDIVKSKKIEIQADYNKFEKYSNLPYIKEYYADGNQIFTILDESIAAGEIVLKAIAPYQDFLGLKGGTSTPDKAGGLTTEERIAFLTNSVEGLVPYFDEIQGHVNKIDQSLNQIDPSRYPEDFQGLKPQATLLQAKQVVGEVNKFLVDGKPILTKTSYLLGKNKPIKYLVLFQNDAELRPTGGFWTAYGILEVNKGKITPVGSDDIYDLDAKFKSTIPAPRPIKDYHINVPYLNVRDMNLSPDFPTSITEFTKAYEKVNGKGGFNAIVAITTKPLVDLIKVVGRVGVSGFGNFTPDPDKRCDGCPNVLYQMLWIAGRPRNYVESDRKGFLGPLMHSTLANAMGQPKEKLGALVGAMLENINQKHIIFYFKDSEIQEAAVKANIAGSITTTDENTDYLALVDANMSSAKTNLFLKQKIRHEIISESGKVQHKVTVTYTNPSKASNCNLERTEGLCLNAAKYRNWFRFYTPKGSTLDKITGSEVEVPPYEEIGKTVFEGFYGNKYPLYAQSSAKTSVQYTSSVPASSNYTLYLQKQAGTKPVDYELVVNGEDYDQFSWTSDKTIKLAL